MGLDRSSGSTRRLNASIDFYLECNMKFLKWSRPRRGIITVLGLVHRYQSTEWIRRERLVMLCPPIPCPQVHVQSFFALLSAPGGWPLQIASFAPEPGLCAQPVESTSREEDRESM